MNFQSVLRVTGFSAWVWTAGAATDTSMGSGLQVREKSLSALIQDLADDEYRVRENATRQIWEIGESALESLQEFAECEDPEQAYRARELIRKIQLHITPDTDPAVIALVERYSRATPNEKVILFDQMHKRRAWRQLLKLFASETNRELQSRLMRSVEGVAVLAARERLLAGDADGARDYLEMAPADADGLLALADFHRSQGTLDAELKRAKSLKGARADAWKLALYRAAGDLESARAAADASGEIMESAVMSMLLGDPLPWLRANQAELGVREIHKPYTDLAIKHWQEKQIQPEDLEKLKRSLKSKNIEERQNAMNSLFLLGQPELAEDAYATFSRLAAFSYFESLERIPEALEMFGLDPDKPDYAGWVEKRFKGLTGEHDDNDRDSGREDRELILLANFLERRGLHDVCEQAFLPPLLALAQEDVNIFTELLSQLFAGNATISSEVLGAPRVANKAAITWAGDSDDHWADVLECAFGGQDEIGNIWDWLAELKPDADRPELFDGMLTLMGMGRDPDGLRAKWLALLWEDIQKAPARRQKELMENMKFVLSQSPDIASNLKLWDMLPEDSRQDNLWREHILDLSGGERWDDAADFFRKQIDRISSAKRDPEPSLYACLASCLRMAGHEREATVNDSIVEKLALGNDAIEIGNGYAYGMDYIRAADWWERAVRQANPNSERLDIALRLHAAGLIEREKWSELAAVTEVSAQMEAEVDSSIGSPLSSLRIRLQADLGRALAGLKSDRAGSISTLAACHGMFPSDGSLADDFFPAIRKAGLIKEHDEWFNTSWARMTAVLKMFPDSDNTCNTAAWLASRAKRNLDQAERLEKHALTLNPEQSAYLDTMAEIQFAKGDRKKAVEWSTRAINFLPMDGMLRRQHDRFCNAPLPR